MKKKSVSLKEFIEEFGGPKKLSDSVGVTRSAVSNWNIGKAIPEPRIMIKVVKLSKGRCSYKNIIEGFWGNE